MPETDQFTNVPQPIHAKTPASASCRMKKKGDNGFLEDLKDRTDKFINALMDEHETCFKKTIEKMFGISKKWQKETLLTRELRAHCLFSELRQP